MKFTLAAAFISTIFLSATALPEPEAARLQRRTCNYPTVPLLRAWQPVVADHFYTTDATEMNNAVALLGYDREGNAATVHPEQTPITIPLYRVYNPVLFDHFYTTSASERDNAVQALGYSDEGIAAYVYETQLCGTVPLYRMFNAVATDHFYTTDAAEKDNAVNGGYTYEGIAAYVNPQP
ncbi:hypothetical protein BD309DRAFT_963246 [Dichomitus squalens]|nr:hypothetical protein BD309DRAFT_963246 [Dichomitus squalens]